MRPRAVRAIPTHHEARAPSDHAPPIVSAIITTHNRAGYLEEAIASVRAQDYGSIEIIVVDDGSTDATREVVAVFGTACRYRFQRNMGVSAARNSGVAMARGAFLAFLDDDDLWVPEKTREQMQALDSEPALDVVYGMAEQFISPELAVESRARFARTAGRVLPAPIACSMLVRRAAFERVGPFDERLRIGVEMDWQARALDVGLQARLLERTVYRRRLHEGNMNVVDTEDQTERLRVVRDVIARRRRQHGDC